MPITTGLTIPFTGIQNNLLIHADPGARSGFLAAWLTDKLDSIHFDVGLNIRPRYKKIHQLYHQDDIKLFNGIKIRIVPTLENIDLLSLLFLRKNVHTQIPSFTRNEYSLETFTKIACFTKEIFQWDSNLDYNLYDYVITFRDTFSESQMINLYRSIHQKDPFPFMIDTLNQTNDLNCINIDKNHASSILKMILLKEQQLSLKEEHRFWSIVDIYNTTPVEKLYETICNYISAENYGVLL